ncbi:hypothetical protein BHM03_00055204 [Ensete ventricosum]|nr:hypothetical protein BHM03_00055204 [Ensete ventricosum]
MTLHCVELFYTFLLCFRSKSNKERGRPAMARPSARAADHSHTPCRGSQLQPRLRGQPLEKGDCAARGHAARGGHQGPAHKRSADSGQPYRQQGRQPQGWPPLGRAVAGRKGPSPPPQRRRRWRSEGKEG